MFRFIKTVVKVVLLISIIGLCGLTTGMKSYAQAGSSSVQTNQVMVDEKNAYEPERHENRSFESKKVTRNKEAEEKKIFEKKEKEDISFKDIEEVLHVTTIKVVIKNHVTEIRNNLQNKVESNVALISNNMRSIQTMYSKSKETKMNRHPKKRDEASKQIRIRTVTLMAKTDSTGNGSRTQQKETKVTYDKMKNLKVGSNITNVEVYCSVQKQKRAIVRKTTMF